MTIDNAPLFTDTYQSFNEFTPIPHSAFIYTDGVEERSTLPQGWSENVLNVDFIQLVEQDNILSLSNTRSECTLSTRSTAKMTDFLQSLSSPNIYVDITGMSHNAWAPLVRCALMTDKLLFCIYTEPQSYKFSEIPREGKIFDLSEKISGIAPIPGFLNLREVAEDKICFIPLLGFEGARFRLILETEQPGQEVIPIVGLPGFQVEYPFHTMLGNKGVLEQNQMWKNVKFAAAHCPFSTLNLLENIAREHADYFFKIAPIGTKPHALAAVLFALAHRDVTELVYDHPKWKVGQTAGQARVHIYNISESLRSHA